MVDTERPAAGGHGLPELLRLSLRRAEVAQRRVIKFGGCAPGPAAMPARSIGLVSPATVNGAPLSETKVKAALVPAAPAVHVPEQLESYTASRSATN